MKPMLAYTIDDTSKIKYPVLVSQKLDGIRCLIIDGLAYTRSLKLIRNSHIQTILGDTKYNGYDGELVVGDSFAKDCYRKTNSGVMSADGEPDFIFYAFDRFDMGEYKFIDRLAAVKDDHIVKRVPHHWAYCEGDLLHIEEKLLEQGAEGVMVRSLDGVYKHGRSTASEGYLGKLKRFIEEEYLIIGFQERMHNTNQAIINELGYTERSSHKENKVGRGDLGALVLVTKEGWKFTCGSGFDDELRRKIFDNQSVYLGQYAKVKSFPIGVKDAPKFPVFVGFRDPSDM